MPVFDGKWPGIDRRSWDKLNMLVEQLGIFMGTGTDGTVVWDREHGMMYVPEPGDFRAMILAGNNPYSWARLRTQAGAEYFILNQQDGGLYGNDALHVLYTIESAAYAGTSITYQTGQTNTIATGDTVQVYGIEPSTYNGTYVVTASTPTQFVVTQAVNPGVYIDGGAVISNVVPSGGAFRPAYEWNQNQKVPPGSIVWVRPKYLTTTDVETEYDFIYCCTLPIVTPVFQESSGGDGGGECMFPPGLPPTASSQQTQQILQLHLEDYSIDELVVNRSGCCSPPGTPQTPKKVSTLYLGAGTYNDYTIPYCDAWEIPLAGDLIFTGFTDYTGGVPPLGRRFFLKNDSAIGSGLTITLTYQDAASLITHRISVPDGDSLVIYPQEGWWLEYGTDTDGPWFPESYPGRPTKGTRQTQIGYTAEAITAFSGVNVPGFGNVDLYYNNAGVLTTRGETVQAFNLGPEIDIGQWVELVLEPVSQTWFVLLAPGLDGHGNPLGPQFDSDSGVTNVNHAIYNTLRTYTNALGTFCITNTHLTAQMRLELSGTDLLGNVFTNELDVLINAGVSRFIYLCTGSTYASGRIPPFRSLVVKVRNSTGGDAVTYSWVAITTPKGV